ncbi:hypothetical protein ACFQ9X_25060 [Catenulispora yoronensis]
MAALFDGPTVAALADVIEARIRDEIEHMSEDEALAFLAADLQDEEPDEGGVWQ